jgi:20S proteasome alpha/beta subunit
MSLGIVFKGPEGIVLAADSRVTLMAQRVQDNVVLPAFFDNAKKLLKVTGQDHVAAVTYGLGAIGQAAPRTANSYLPEFEAELRDADTGRLSVEDFTTKLGEFFSGQWQAAGMPADAEPMIFLVGGYDEDAAYGRVFQVVVPNAIAPVEQNPGESFGVTWGGQIQSVTRLIGGYDPQLPRVVQEYLGLDPARQPEIESHLKGALSLPIPYQFLPLQDCVDLAILLVRTTAQLQTFLVDVRGVGGDIDVATITRTEGFRAVQQKEITGERFEF